ncbi:MAG: hypothetical protein AUJ52_08075 [Elusimicrobia bacterium CG1_02_63_36]|nr:MAG: hypothetical protein AUJ52_08075 [Elusimicrobia bacterium CG1_02_63_36]
MNCSSLKEGISAYVDGALKPAEREALVAHLDLCPECRSDWKAFESGRAALSLHPPQSMPDALRERLSALTEGQTEVATASWLDHLRTPRTGWAFAAAAVLIAVFVQFAPFEAPSRTIPLSRLLAEHSDASRKSADIGRGLLAAPPYDSGRQTDAFK